MGATCLRHGASGVIKLLHYVIHPSPLSFLRFQYLSGREVSRVRMRGVAAFADLSHVRDLKAPELTHVSAVTKPLPSYMSAQ